MHNILARANALSRVLSSKFVTRENRFTSLPQPTEVTTPELISCAPALYNKDHLHRVISCGFGATLEDEIEKLDATSFMESPLARYELGESLVVGGQIFSRNARYLMSVQSPLRALGSNVVEFKSASLANTMQGLHYFGHWLGDDCALYEALRGAPNILSMRRPNWPDRHFYESAFGQTWNELDFFKVSELTIYRELGFNRDKADRLRLLRQKLRASGPRRTGGQVAYISRGRLGENRNMSNLDAVVEAFSKAGIRIVEPGVDSITMIGELLDAAAIVAIEGSHACHAIYSLADKGAVLILQPPERFYNPHHEWARLLGMRYGFVVGEKDEVSFKIHPDEALRMVDRLLAVPKYSDA
jgi:hypothetical protein